MYNLWKHKPRFSYKLYYSNYCTIKSCFCLFVLLFGISIISRKCKFEQPPPPTPPLKNPHTYMECIFICTLLLGEVVLFLFPFILYLGFLSRRHFNGLSIG